MIGISSFAEYEKVRIDSMMRNKETEIYIADFFKSNHSKSKSNDVEIELTNLKEGKNHVVSSIFDVLERRSCSNSYR